MEDAILGHFKQIIELSNNNDVTLSCSHISRGTGLKQRQVFACLNKSSKFTRLGGNSVGFGGTNYSFYRLNSC